jgi:hypothetical protein
MLFNRTKENIKMCTYFILKSKNMRIKVQSKFVLDKLLLNKMGDFHVTTENQQKKHIPRNLCKQAKSVKHQFI